MSRAIRRASSGRTPSSSFESSPSPSACEPAADPLAPRRDAGRRRPRASASTVSVGEREAELRDEPETAEDAQRILAEALRARRCAGAGARGRATPSNGSTSSPVSSRLRDRVHREVATPHVVLDRDRSGPRRSRSRGAPARRCARRRGGVSSMPAGTSRAHRAVARVEAHADELAVHLHVLDAPVRLERRAEPGLVDPRDEEVLVGVLDPEQLVAHRARRRRTRRGGASGCSGGSRSARCPARASRARL